jgi:hypothetical protein
MPPSSMWRCCIFSALSSSGSSLEWVVNGYALAFSGLMLLGGRSGDLLALTGDSS